MSNSWPSGAVRADGASRVDDHLAVRRLAAGVGSRRAAVACPQALPRHRRKHPVAGAQNGSDVWPDKCISGYHRSHKHSNKDECTASYLRFILEEDLVHLAGCRAGVLAALPVALPGRLPEAATGDAPVADATLNADAAGGGRCAADPPDDAAARPPDRAAAAAVAAAAAGARVAGVRLPAVKPGDRRLTRGGELVATCDRGWNCGQQACKLCLLDSMMLSNALAGYLNGVTLDNKSSSIQAREVKSSGQMTSQMVATGGQRTRAFCTFRRLTGVYASPGRARPAVALPGALLTPPPLAAGPPLACRCAAEDAATADAPVAAAAKWPAALASGPVAD